MELIECNKIILGNQLFESILFRILRIDHVLISKLFPFSFYSNTYFWIIRTLYRKLKEYHLPMGHSGNDSM